MYYTVQKEKSPLYSTFCSQWLPASYSSHSPAGFSFANYKARQEQDAFLILFIISIYLLENARYPLKYLAQKVFLSSPAVSTRIERMEKAGIITGYHATIDPVALGYHITAFINLTLDPKQKNEFYPYVTDCPNVLECNCVTGTYSIMLKVAFPSTMELDTFIGHLQQFGNTQTQIVFSTAVPPRGVGIETDETDTAEEIKKA